LNVAIRTRPVLRAVACGVKQHTRLLRARARRGTAAP
jgi:hypothetical protein